MRSEQDEEEGVGAGEEGRRPPPTTTPTTTAAAAAWWWRSRRPADLQGRDLLRLRLERLAVTALHVLHVTRHLGGRQRRAVGGPRRGGGGAAQFCHRLHRVGDSVQQRLGVLQIGVLRGRSWGVGVPWGPLWPLGGRVRDERRRGRARVKRNGTAAEQEGPAGARAPALRSGCGSAACRGATRAR